MGWCICITPYFFGRVKSGSSAEVDDVAAVALGGTACRQLFELHCGSALGGYFLAQVAAGFSFPVKRLRHRGWPANLAESENFDLKVSTIIGHAQPVADANLARGLGGLAIGLNSAQFAGLRRQRPCLEKSRGPEPFVHAYAGHYRWAKPPNKNLSNVIFQIVYHRQRKAYRSCMDIHLVDGTYELFRHFFAVPAAADVNGQEIGAVRGVLNSVLSMIEGGATHIGVATDHVVESFRNDLYSGYKTSEGVPPELLSQFPILEEALEAMGVVVWPMVDFEADDALASAAANSAKDDQVGRVFICTPDKDLAQCVVGERVVQLDRRQNLLRDEAGVVAKFGVKPRSIPDYLAVVGDSADGFPGVAGWGAKAAALVLSQYPHLEDIPKDWQEWDKSIRRARSLAASLFGAWEDALLFRTLATLRLDVPVFETVEDLRWKGARGSFEEFCQRLRSPNLPRRAAAAQSGSTRVV